MEMSTSWRVRFELRGGGYTPLWISRKGGPLGRIEVQEWADTQVRINEDYAAVDEIYATHPTDSEQSSAKQEATQ